MDWDDPGYYEDVPPYPDEPYPDDGPNQELNRQNRRNERERPLTDEEAQELLDSGQMRCYDENGDYDEAATIEAILTRVKRVDPDPPNGLPIQIVNIGDPNYYRNNWERIADDDEDDFDFDDFEDNLKWLQEEQRRNWRMR